jgi:hypothetical protein
MRSMSMLQLVGGVAAAGVVAAGTTALTGTGVSWGGTGTGTAAQYVGGTLTQTVSGGASITGITYTTTSSSATSVNDQVTAIAITLTGANGAYLTVTPSQSGGGLGGSADNWNCTGHVATGATGEAPIHPTAPKVKINNATATVTCNTWNSAAGPAANGGYYTGLTGVALAVTNS